MPLVVATRQVLPVAGDAADVGANGAVAGESAGQVAHSADESKQSTAVAPTVDSHPAAPAALSLDISYQPFHQLQEEGTLERRVTLLFGSQSGGPHVHLAPSRPRITRRRHSAPRFGRQRGRDCERRARASHEGGR